jgi:Fic family protein
VEVNFPSGKKPQYFLVKDVIVGSSKSKVKKYIGTKPLTAKEKLAVSSQFSAEMELKVAEKKAELSPSAFKPQCMSNEVLADVERVRSIHNSVLGLLTADEVSAYEGQFEIRYIQGTTSIEGNTLTRGQAADLLLHGVTPKDKSLREINEVQNFRKVLLFRNAFRGHVTESFTRHLHAFVMDSIDLETAGVFRRRDDLGIAGCDLKVTPSSLIEEELNAIIDEYYQTLKIGGHPFEAAVLFHYKFEMIHPFTDGNGRVGREILNYMLARAKYPRLLFLGEERENYIAALKRGNEQKYGELVDIFGRLIVEQRLRILEARLKQVAPGVKRVGQLRLEDFVTA